MSKTAAQPQYSSDRSGFCETRGARAELGGSLVYDHSSCTAISVTKWMDPFKLTMFDGDKSNLRKSQLLRDRLIHTFGFLILGVCMACSHFIELKPALTLRSP